MGEISMSGSTRERGVLVIGLRTFHPGTLLSTLLVERQTEAPVGVRRGGELRGSRTVVAGEDRGFRINADGKERVSAVL